jgi:hypothetical protein
MSQLFNIFWLFCHKTVGYNKIDFKDHALFKVKDKIILIHKFIDPKGNQISNDTNLLIINSNVFIVELIVSLNLNVQLEMLFAICAIILLYPTLRSLRNIIRP